MTYRSPRTQKRQQHQCPLGYATRIVLVGLPGALVLLTRRCSGYCFDAMTMTMTSKVPSTRCLTGRCLLNTRKGSTNLEASDGDCLRSRGFFVGIHACGTEVVALSELARQLRLPHSESKTTAAVNSASHRSRVTHCFTGGKPCFAWRSHS